MVNQLVHLTNFPYNSIVSEQYLLLSDGKKVASVTFITRDSAIGDDVIEVRVDDDEPYEVDDLEKALEDLDQIFGDVDVDQAVNMTIGQARDAGFIG